MTRVGEPADEWQGESPRTWCARWGVPAVHVFATTPSTNDVAIRLAESGAAAGTTVISETQTAGRGQHGRQWSDGEGRSLLMSVILRSALGTVDPSTMPVRIGTAVARTIETETGVRTWLKWPNDLVVPARGKLGGILCEGATGAGSAWIIAGIGLNIDQAAADFAGLGQPAVSLMMCGVQADKASLAGAILRALSPYHVHPPPIDDTTLRSIRQRDALLGQEISLDGQPAGTAEGIDAQGRLMVRSGGPDGTLRRVITGSALSLAHDRTTGAHTNADESRPDL